MTTINFEIDELECSSCANSVVAVLKKNGIDNIDVDVVNKTASIEFDESKFSKEDIKKIIKSAGFTAEVIE